MSAVISNVLDQIVSLVNGSTGSTRTCTAGDFEHVTFPVLESGARMVGDNYRPYNIVYEGRRKDDITPSNVSGNRRYSTHEIRLIMGYGAMPQQQLALTKTITDDQYTIRHCLEWPHNWTAVSGWCGCTIEDTQITEETDSSGNPEYYISELTLTVIVREEV